MLSVFKLVSCKPDKIENDPPYEPKKMPPMTKQKVLSFLEVGQRKMVIKIEFTPLSDWKFVPLKRVFNKQ